MKNIEKYKNFVLKNLNWCKMESDLRKLGCKPIIDCAHTLCEDCKESFFKWLLEEYKEPVLDDKEREYLSAVIKPYKNKVTGIVKVNDVYEPNSQYIRIIVKSHVEIENINLPWFERNTMYKGMKANKKYTVEELGL